MTSLLVRLGSGVVTVPPYQRVRDGKVENVSGYTYRRKPGRIIHPTRKFGDLPSPGWEPFRVVNPDVDTPVWRDFGRMADESSPGNCYQVALEMMLHSEELGLKNPRIVHASVVGDGGPLTGRRFGHAWVEADAIQLTEGGSAARNAYDWASGNRAVVSAPGYRQQAQATDIHEYTKNEAFVWALRSGVYGPWEGEVYVNDPETGGLKKAEVLAA